MSSYIKKSQHPETGKMEDAFWMDDYYGPHQYGVKFMDGKIFREGLIPAHDITIPITTTFDDFEEKTMFKVGDKIQMRSDKWIKENLYFEIIFIGEQQMLGRVADGTECTLMRKPESSYKIYDEPKKKIKVAPAAVKAELDRYPTYSLDTFASAQEALEAYGDCFIKWPYNDYSWTEVDEPCSTELDFNPRCTVK